MKRPMFVLLLFVILQGSARSQRSHTPWSSDNLLERIERESLSGIFLFNPQTKLDSFFSFCRKANIDIVFSNESLYRNETFLQKAKSEGVAVGLNFPVFFNQDYLKKHPDHYTIDSQGKKAIQEWLHFACPSEPEFMSYQENQLRELIELTDPAMVSLDFIRFFVFWEKVYPETDLLEIVDGCYCHRCMENFQSFSGIHIEGKTAEWIKANMMPQWAKWKCSVIEQRVKALSGIIKEYQIPVALKVVPWRPEDFDGAIQSVAGQDIDRIKNYVDIFIPMTYSHMVGREPKWIHKIAAYLHSATDKPILTCVEIEKTYVEKNIPEQEFTDMMGYGIMQPSSGLILFHYDYLNNAKKDLILTLSSE